MKLTAKSIGTTRWSCGKALSRVISSFGSVDTGGRGCASAQGPCSRLTLGRSQDRRSESESESWSTSRRALGAHQTFLRSSVSLVAARLRHRLQRLPRPEPVDPHDSRPCRRRRSGTKALTADRVAEPTPAPRSNRPRPPLEATRSGHPIGRDGGVCQGRAKTKPVPPVARLGKRDVRCEARQWDQFQQRRSA